MIVKANKYIQPEYTVSKIETTDIITASSQFKINEDAENNKIDFIVSPGDIFGV